MTVAQWFIAVGTMILLLTAVPIFLTILVSLLIDEYKHDRGAFFVEVFIVGGILLTILGVSLGGLDT